MALQPVLRNLQQSSGAMQPGAPEDPVQHEPWPCTQTQEHYFCLAEERCSYLLGCSARSWQTSTHTPTRPRLPLCLPTNKLAHAQAATLMCRDLMLFLASTAHRQPYALQLSRFLLRLVPGRRESAGGAQALKGLRGSHPDPQRWRSLDRLTFQRIWLEGTPLL